MSALEKDAWRITFSEVKAAAEDIIEEARKGLAEGGIPIGSLSPGFFMQDYQAFP